MTRIPRYSSMLPVIAADPTQRTYSSLRFYTFPYKYLYIHRLTMALSLLGDASYNTTLDAGIGSGAFLKELRLRSRRLVGTDIHGFLKQTRAMCDAEGITPCPELVRSDLTALPFQAEAFDLISCVSVLEFIQDIDAVFSEFARTLKRNGTLIVGAPVFNRLTDLLYRFAVGFSDHKTQHKSRHDNIIAIAGNSFRIERIINFPSVLPINLSLFFAMRLSKI
jgi:SAM-dependent methyltransferase